MGGSCISGVAKLDDLTCVFSTVVSYLMLIGGFISFIMLVIGAFKYITSAGDPKAVASAHSTLSYAIGGLILTACAFIFILVLSAITGNLNILNFRIFLPN